MRESHMKDHISVARLARSLSQFGDGIRFANLCEIYLLVRSISTKMAYDRSERNFSL